MQVQMVLLPGGLDKDYGHWTNSGGGGELGRQQREGRCHEAWSLVPSLHYLSPHPGAHGGMGCPRALHTGPSGLTLHKQNRLCCVLNTVPS